MTQLIIDFWSPTKLGNGTSSKQGSLPTQPKSMQQSSLTRESLPMLDQLMLKELEITSIGEALCILKQAKEATSQTTYTKASAAKFPQLNLEMSPQQFRKFWTDWDIATKIMNMPRSQANIHLYNCSDEAMQNAIDNTHWLLHYWPRQTIWDGRSISHSEVEPHCLSPFVSILQSENEPIQSYLVSLRATALDYDFTYPLCEHDRLDIYIKDQLIKGIANDALQTNLLVKAGTLKSMSKTSAMQKYSNRHYKTKI